MGINDGHVDSLMIWLLMLFLARPCTRMDSTKFREINDEICPKRWN